MDAKDSSAVTPYCSSTQDAKIMETCSHASIFSKVKVTASTNYKEQTTPLLTSQDRLKERENETWKYGWQRQAALRMFQTGPGIRVPQKGTNHHLHPSTTVDQKDKEGTPYCSSIQDAKMMKTSWYDSTFPKLRGATYANLTEQSTPSAPPTRKEINAVERMDDKDKEDLQTALEICLS